MAFESIYMSGPEPAELSHPGIDILEWLRFQMEETPTFKLRTPASTGLPSYRTAALTSAPVG
jgi:hypothetical protein